MDSFTLSALNSASGIMALMLGCVVLGGWLIGLLLNAWLTRRERRATSAERQARALRVVNNDLRLHDDTRRRLQQVQRVNGKRH